MNLQKSLQKSLLKFKKICTLRFARCFFNAKNKEVQTMSITETMLYSTEALSGYYYFTE